MVNDIFTFLLLSNVEPCQDNLDFSFTLFTLEIKNCTWLTENSTKTIIRRNNWCSNEPFNGQLIWEKCPESCGLCGCNDNPYYEFNFWNTDTMYGCSWIDEHLYTDPVNMAKVNNRRNTWCDATKANYAGALEHCPKACGLCDWPSTAPSQDPDDKPAPYDCEDDEDYDFSFWNTGTMYGCSWISEHLYTDPVNMTKVNNRRNTWCDATKRNYAGALESCPKACGLCDLPSAIPSQSPSDKPIPAEVVETRSPANDMDEKAPSPPKTKAPSAPKTKAPSAPKTKSPTKKTQAPLVKKTKEPTMKETKEPTVKKTKAPTVKKTKEPSPAKKTKEPSVKKTKAPKTKSCKKKKDDTRSVEVGFELIGDGSITLASIFELLCSGEVDEVDRMLIVSARSLEEGEECIESVEVTNLQKENECMYHRHNLFFLISIFTSMV